MRSVGQTLKDARLAKFYTLEEVEKATKIRKELLEALEQDNYKKLPPATFVQGFIKNYCRFLGLSEDKLLAIFRREFSDKKNPPRILSALGSPLSRPGFRITPTKVISSVIIGLVIVFMIYLWIEYRLLAGAPFLEIVSPTEGQTFQTETIKVVGKTDPESKIKINNQDVEVDFGGNFSQELKLSDSASTITITSTSKYGKTSKEDRSVFLKK